MRKGLTLTLMTVAIALVSVQAMAVAPTISDMPNVYVGSNVGVTGAQSYWTEYVYPDAIDLNTMATDDFTTPSSLMWSYTGSSLKYLINGVNPLNLSTSDPTSPTGSLIINRVVAGGEQDRDGKANTITIRNKNLAPLGGSVVTGQPFGIQDGQLVTFFCSDGNLYSSKTVYFYTWVDGYNQLSGGTPWKKVTMSGSRPNPDTFTSGGYWAKDKNNWKATGTVTTSTLSGSGMCINVSQTGSNQVDLISPYQYFTLTANKLYKLTLKMNGSQVSPGSTPLWDFIVQNAKPGDAAVGLNLYAQDTMFYDNTGFGGQNTVLSTPSGVDYVIYFAPDAVETAQWNDVSTGAFTSGNQAQVQPLCEFRILDIDGASYGFGDQKSGSVCIQSLTVEAADISRVQTVSSLVNIASLAAANSGGTGNVQVQSLYDSQGRLSTVSFASGAVTITPNSTPLIPDPSGMGTGQVNGQQLEAAEIRPATDLTFGTDPAGASFLDNWPIQWNSNELLRLRVDVTAPDSALAARPWDAIMLDMQGMDSELLYESYITSSMNIASPKFGQSTTYETFFNTMNKPYSSSNPAVANYQHLRWLIRFFNVYWVNFPTWDSQSALNTSPIKVTGIRVDKVEVK